ncbi:MAG: phosphomannomutase [Thaumarchaeota archaeon]|nr:phosphomannomutase [Nitrososphaerota archaeon]
MKVSISGVRGIFGTDLKLEDVIYYCKNFSHLVKSKKCIVGRDTRPSSQIVTNVAVASLLERGIDVYDIGVSPTPVIFREARKYGSGLIITSSHNPLEWNGLKFILDGRGINESELEYLTRQDKFENNGIGKEIAVDSRYIDEASKVIGNVKGSPKITIDVGGGAAFDVAPRLLKRLGCRTSVINGTPGNSTRGPDPTSDRLTSLVHASRAGLGFAFDLDGDRLVVVKDGKKQSPDVTLGLGVAGALEKGYKKFVLSIDTSVSIEKFIKNEGGKVNRSKVGEANVVDMMLKTRSQAGGEGSSAGFILPEFNMCRDGILTSGLIASMAGTRQFDEINNFMEGYHQVRTKVSVDSKLHKKTLETFLKKMKKQASQIITIDGIKSIIDEDSWVLVRQSNTEHIIRVSAESNNPDKVRQIEKQTSKMVRQSYEESR